MTRIHGWKLVALLTLLLLVAFGVVVALYGTDEHGLGVLLRVTARLSFLLFLPVYLASSARRLWPNETTKWMLKNRRYLGLSFFVAHMLHLDAIFLFDTLLGDAFVVELPTLVFGGLAYVFVTAMALTSSDRAVKSLGAQRWSRLHRFGIHYIWLIWTAQWTLNAAIGMPAYGLFTLSCLAALGVRIAARRSRALRGQPAAAATT